MASLPDPVVGAAALVMFAMVAGVGIRILRHVDFDGTSNLLIVAVSLVAGMVPVTAPHIYDRLPAGARIIFGSAITCTAVCAFALNLLFNHAPGAAPRPDAPGRTHRSTEEGTTVPDSRLVIENCALATMDASGTEYATGHVVVAGHRIESAAPVPRPGTWRTSSGGSTATVIW